MSIVVEKSRFAALKIEDDDENVPIKQNGKSTKQQQQQQQQKQKQQQQQKKGKQKTKSFNENVASASGEESTKRTTSTSEDWQTWKEKDEELVDNLFKDQLKQAMLESKIEFEQNKQHKKQDQPKVNNKPIKMSLDEFQKYSGKPEQKKDVNDKEIESEEFLQEIDANVNKLIANERIHLEKSSTSSIDKFVYLQYQAHIEAKDKEIEDLNNKVNSLKEEICEVKTRNKQLAYIVAQGEIKDKSDLIKETMELTAVKNELIQQIEELNRNLEQEKSKVHQLENELKNKSSSSTTNKKKH